MRTTDLDVTIATLNSGKTIARCLQHIQENLPHHNIIVVDGGSKDNTIEICNSFDAKVIETKDVIIDELAVAKCFYPCGPSLSPEDVPFGRRLGIVFVY